MDKRERQIRNTLSAGAFSLIKAGAGFHIRDQVTKSFYLGEKTPATLEECIEFAQTLDECGVPAPDIYVPVEEEDCLAAGSNNTLNEEITRLSRQRDILLQHGKNESAAKLKDKIQELEEEAEEREAYDALEMEVRTFLQEQGCRLEIGGLGYYRAADKVTGEIRYGKGVEACLEDVAGFAASIGMRASN